MQSFLRRFFWAIALFAGLIGLILMQANAQDNQSKGIVTVIKIQGAIGPAVQNYVRRGIEKSTVMHAKAIVLTLDTPGGLSTSMRGIIKEILGSSIPVISYVYPSGARAASAGTYILYASQIAAMAPGTNLGAATPVGITTPATPGAQDKKQKTKKSASEMKVINDAKAYIRSLAQMRKRNEKWAVRAVTHAESLSAKEALKRNVINNIADSIPDLLKQVNGKTVSVGGVTTQLKTAGARPIHIEQDWRNKILTVITDPSVAYILLMIGVYGLFFEFMNPGFIVPGVTGGIALLLALYAFQLMPINYVGFTLIVLGLIFMVAEAFVPSFGALGFGGIIGFVVGSFLLMDTNVPGYSLPWQLIIGITITTILFMIGSIQLIIRSRRHQVVTGEEGMIGREGVIEQDGENIWVIVGGERWQVKSDDLLTDKQHVTVIGVDGLILIVKPRNSS